MRCIDKNKVKGVIENIPSVKKSCDRLQTLWGQSDFLHRLKLNKHFTTIHSQTFYSAPFYKLWVHYFKKERFAYMNVFLDSGFKMRKTCFIVKTRLDMMQNVLFWNFRMNFMIWSCLSFKVNGLRGELLKTKWLKHRHQTHPPPPPLWPVHQPVLCSPVLDSLTSRTSWTLSPAGPCAVESSPVLPSSPATAHAST